jgi:rod shape-determining protein MreD
MRTLLRIALVGAAATLALALELSVAPALRLPYAVPDVTLLTVLALAAGWGTAGGAVGGFAVGFAQDIAPPSLSAIGRHALVLTLVGALAGRAAREVGHSAVRTCLFAGLYALGAAVLNLLIGLALGSGSGLTHRSLLPALGATALYTVVATPLVVPGLAALARRVEGPGPRFLAPAGNAVDAPVGTGAASADAGLSTETERV